MTEVKAILPELLNHLFRRLRHDLAEVPMDGLRFSHLRVLSAVPSEGANVTALAESVGMTKQGCGQFVSQLSASGHLETAPDPADGRVRLVQRTPDGDRVLAEVTAALEVAEARMADEVGPRRYASFRRVLEELLDPPA